ncbi:MAG: putative Ig domain-containing protein [Planctomycetota bacterium]
MKLLSTIGLAVLALLGQAITAQVVDSTPDSSLPQVTGQVDAMLEHNNVLYIGGAFTAVGSTSINNLAAIDLNTNSVLSWSPNPDAGVQALYVEGSTLYVGGSFNNMGTSVRQSLAAFDLSSGRALTSWAPLCVDTASNFFGDTVYDIEVLGTTMYVAGGFSQINGTPRGGLASFDLTNTVSNHGLTNWDPNLGGGLPGILGIFGAQGMEIVNNMVVIHGGWEYCGGNHMDDNSPSPHTIYNNTNGMLAFSPTGTGARITTFEPIVSTVNSMTSSGNMIYISGLINSVGGGGTTVSRASFAELDATTDTTSANPATSMDPGFDSRAFGLSADGGVLAAAGQFTMVGSTAADGVAAIDLANGGSMPWGASVPGAWRSLVSGNKVYIGGNFTQVNSSAHQGLAAFDVIPDLLISTTSPLAGGNHQQAFSQQFAYTGGGSAITWTAAGLPTNWSISSTGLLSAIAADVVAGSYNFNVTATDNFGQVDTRAFGVVIVAPTLSITTGNNLPAGTSGVTYATTLTATGGQAAYAWSVATGSNLPGGWTLNASTGLISAGAASVAQGSYSFSIEVTDGIQTDSRAFNLVVQAAGAPLSITSPATLPNGTHSQSYSYQMAATGGIGSYTWFVNAGTVLPTNWNINGSTGLISAASADVVAGSYNFTVEVTDGTSNDQLAVSVFIGFPSIQITTTTLPAGTEGIAYAASLNVTGGSGSGYSWSIAGGILPNGVNGLPASGPGAGLTGTPTAAGTFTFTLSVTDSASNSVSQSFSIVIDAAAPGPGPNPGDDGDNGGDLGSGGCFVANGSNGGIFLIVVLGLLALASRRRRIAG